MKLLVLLLLSVPLSAQQTVVVPDVTITNDHPITNEITVEVMTDSVRDARIAEAVEGLTAAIASQGCDQCGGTFSVVRIGQGALVLAAFFIGWQLKRIADKPNGDDIHNEGDTHVEVNIPPHGNSGNDDHGES